MNKPSENKTETSISSEPPAQVSEKPPGSRELSEQELNKVSGGSGGGETPLTIGSATGGAGTGKIK